jgi:nifR3 family TIM-barrel protein
MLQLAPMEGVGDSAFRKAIATIGGFDEAVRDFLRVPTNAHVESLAKVYDPHELGPIPLAAQIMGSDPDLMAGMARELVKRGAPRIDINCGCPSNTVTGRGAGSSLLKEPNILNEVATAVVKAVEIPVTLKMRSGFEDTSLFEENLKAAEESGITYLTLHPRTKVDGYGPPARWDLIARAKQILKIPLVGNGDITTPERALDMLRETKCDMLMIGRGALQDPFIFHRIKARFNNTTFTATSIFPYLETYLSHLSNAPNKIQVNKLKQLAGYLLKSDILLRQKVLTSSFENAYDLKNFLQELLKANTQNT